MITVETYENLPRKLGYQAFVILGLLQAAKMGRRGPVTAQWLFDRAPGFGKNTITDALRKLTDPEIQLALRVQGGWVLNDQGAFQLPLGYALVDGQNPENEIPSERENPCGREFQAESRLDSLKDLKDSELSLNLLDSRETENKKLLENAYLLFGKPVTWHESFARLSQDEILAWFAQAFDNREKLTRPYGLVFNGLMGKLRQKTPDKHYQANPLRYLPQDFLEACGLVQYSCCGFEFAHRADLEKHQVETHKEPEMPEFDEDSEPNFAPELVDSRIALAWKQELDHLELTPQAANYLADAIPILWDGHLMTLAVASQYVAEWLNDRLRQMIARDLCGILNCPADVMFVVL